MKDNDAMLVLYPRDFRAALKAQFVEVTEKFNMVMNAREQAECDKAQDAFEAALDRLGELNEGLARAWAKSQKEHP